MPEDAREITDAISQALSELRLAGVDGPYSVLLSADVYTLVSETTEHGYPIREHLNRLVDGEIIWAPAIDGAFVLSTRGGDFDLQLGTDVSIGYLRHDADTVQLYLQETLTFLCYTSEARSPLRHSRFPASWEPLPASAHCLYADTPRSAGSSRSLADDPGQAASPSFDRSQPPICEIASSTSGTLPAPVMNEC